MRWRSSSQRPQTNSMRWLCLDPGDRRTGVAVSSPEGSFAIPVTVLEHERGGPAPEMIEELLSEHDADALLVGLPLSMDGSITAQTNSALALTYRIAAYFDSQPATPPGIDLPHPETGLRQRERRAARQGAPLRIQLWDERLSSWDARRAMEIGRAEKRAKRGRKPSLDAHAATVILQSFLSTRDGEPPPHRDSTTDTGSRSSYRD